LELPTQRVDAPDEFVTAEAITEETRAAVAAGFSAVNVTDHPAPDARWLDAGGHHALDPFVALSFAAAANPTIKLHTNIYVAAYRNPFLGAKLVQSLDVVSGGRLILGVASGYLKPEFAALGIDFTQRGALLDDALEVLDEVLAGGDVAREGSGYRARGVRVRPVRTSGRPPIWIGGNSRIAMKRAVAYEGWAPFHTAPGLARTTRTAVIETTDDLAAAVAEVRRMVADSHRGEDRPFDVCWSEALFFGDDSPSIDEKCSRVERLRDAGVTWTTVSAPGATRSEWLENVASFERDVISATEHL
jgi:probable F420-dependent oxidoreductase